MAFDSSKCGKKTIHLQAKDTGKHFAKLMTCNKLECPNCQPVIAARIKKKIRYYAQHERLVFFNTITSTLDFDDLEKIFQKIRRELSVHFTIEGYMQKKKVSREKAEVWYQKKKERYIWSDVLVEIGKISRMEAIIDVAKQKKVFYHGLTEDKKKEFRYKNKKLIDYIYNTYFNNNTKDENLKKELYDKILKRFEENEKEDFKFIRVIEFHKNGQPHYHFISNKYIPHTLLKKVTVEGVSEVYDNTYIVEDALNRNKDLDVSSDVSTDIVSNYVSKITDYITKDTIEMYSDLKKDKRFNKKIISSSDSIKIFSDKSEPEDLKYKKIGVFDYALNAASYEIPIGTNEQSAEDFIKFHSLRIEDELSVRTMKRIGDLNLSDVEMANYVIAERLKQIGSYKDLILKGDFEVIDGLSEEQESVINQFKTSRISLLIGRAGTGKSFTITSLLKSLRLNPLTTSILTYTGKASSRLRELFEANDIGFYKPKTIHKACSSSFNGKFLKNEENTLNCEYLIIDEVSMIPKGILAKLLLAVPSYVKVLFAGDDAQLPPVNDVSIIPELQDSPYVKTVQLTKVFRSNDRVLSFAHKVLNKKMIDYEVFEDGFEDIVHRLISENYQILTNTKRMTKEINMIVQSNKNEITRCFNDFKYNVGDRIMIVANSSPREVSNGDTGRICSYNDDGLFIILDHENRQVFYKYEDTEEITPAYAITVHKSQGSEYEKVAVIFEDQPRLNTNNLLYTAVTRAKHEVKVFVPNSSTMEMLIFNKPKTDNVITLQNINDLLHKKMFVGSL